MKSTSYKLNRGRYSRTKVDHSRSWTIPWTELYRTRLSLNIKKNSTLYHFNFKKERMSLSVQLLLI